MAYQFFSDLERDFHSPIDYIANSLKSLSYTTAHLICRQFKLLEINELNSWILRMNSEGNTKLLELMEIELYPGPQEPTTVLRKIALSFKVIHKILFQKFQNDPFNDWQYNRPLSLLKTLVLKYESNNWEINRDDLEYVLKNLSNPNLQLFSDALSDNVIRRESITEKQGKSLLPPFEIVKRTLEERGMVSQYFNQAYLALMRSQMQFEKIEGTYLINHPIFSKLILLNKNGRSLVAGINSRDRNVSILFENIDDIDRRTGQFIAGSTSGDAFFILKFKSERPGVISGCLGDICFQGHRVETFPNYLNKLNTESDTLEKNPKKTDVVGSYQGVFQTPTGKSTAGTLKIDVLHGKYMGGMRLNNGIFVAFGDGIQENKGGIVYILGPAYSVGALHQFRGFINKQGRLEGVWISTNIGTVAHFALAKVKK